MKSTKYDIFFLKIDEILILESGHFVLFLTEGEAKSKKKRERETISL